MQNQILRNNLGNKLIEPKQKIEISFAIFFILSTIIFSCLSFAGGFFLQSYYAKLSKVKIQNVSVKPNDAKIEHKKYEINLGSFKNKEDAQDFADKISELGVVVVEDSNIYSVKLKDKFDFQHALTTSEIIRSEYSIISTIMEKEIK